MIKQFKMKEQFNKFVQDFYMLTVSGGLDYFHQNLKFIGLDRYKIDHLRRQLSEQIVFMT